MEFTVSSTSLVENINSVFDLSIINSFIILIIGIIFGGLILKYVLYHIKH